MKHYIGPHRALTSLDFAELALGTPLELWLGVEGESDEDREARLAAARDILAEDPEMPDRLTALALESLVLEAAGLARATAVPMVPRAPRNKRLARLTTVRRAA